MTTRGVWTLEPWENYLENGSHVWQDWDEIEFKDGGWYCAQHAYCNVRVCPAAIVNNPSFMLLGK